MSDWCTIESDPGVFTSLIESFGVQNAQLTEDDTPHDLFFARQVTTTNACATQAISSILLNAPAANDDGDEGTKEQDVGKIILGPTLEGLKAFTSTFPPDIKGEAIGVSEDIRMAHNSFARKETFDVFHFIAYVPHKEQVYELDGLQHGPILSGDVHGEKESTNTDLAWLQITRNTIQTRIEKYAATEIKFNLMTLTADKRVGIQKKLKSLKDAGMEDGDESIAHLQVELAGEEEKRQQWQQENERRRHSYLDEQTIWWGII